MDRLLSNTEYSECASLYKNALSEGNISKENFFKIYINAFQRQLKNIEEVLSLNNLLNAYDEVNGLTPKNRSEFESLICEKENQTKYIKKIIKIIEKKYFEKNFDVTHQGEIINISFNVRENFIDIIESITAEKVYDCFIDSILHAFSNSDNFAAFKIKLDRNFESEINKINFHSEKEESFRDLFISGEEFFLKTFYLKVDLIKELNHILSLSKLTKREKKVLMYCCYDGISIKKVSEMLNLSYKNTFRILCKALCNVRRSLYKHHEFTLQSYYNDYYKI